MRKRSEKFKGFLKNIKNKLRKSYFSGLILLRFLTALHNINACIIHYFPLKLQFLNDYELFKPKQSRSLLEIKLALKNCINGCSFSFFKCHQSDFISLS